MPNPTSRARAAPRPSGASRGDRGAAFGLLPAGVQANATGPRTAVPTRTRSHAFLQAHREESAGYAGSPPHASSGGLPAPHACIVTSF